MKSDDGSPYRLCKKVIRKQLKIIEAKCCHGRGLEGSAEVTRIRLQRGAISPGTPSCAKTTQLEVKYTTKVAR